MARLVIPREPGARALRLAEIEVRVIEFVLRIDGEVASQEILCPRQGIEAHPAIIRAPAELVRGFGKENAGARSRVELQGASQILIQWGPVCAVVDPRTVPSVGNTAIVPPAHVIAVAAADLRAGNDIERERRDTKVCSGQSRALLDMGGRI